MLFVEKEGFHRQIQQAQIQERFDVMLMKQQGMSVVASRRLLDDLAARVAAGRIDKVLVAHDFDIAGWVSSPHSAPTAADTRLPGGAARRHRPAAHGHPGDEFANPNPWRLRTGRRMPSGWRSAA